MRTPTFSRAVVLGFALVGAAAGVAEAGGGVLFTKKVINHQASAFYTIPYPSFEYPDCRDAVSVSAIRQKTVEIDRDLTRRETLNDPTLILSVERLYCGEGAAIYPPGFQVIGDVPLPGQLTPNVPKLEQPYFVNNNGMGLSLAVVNVDATFRSNDNFLSYDADVNLIWDARGAETFRDAFCYVVETEDPAMCVVYKERRATRPATLRGDLSGEATYPGIDPFFVDLTPGQFAQTGEFIKLERNSEIIVTREKRKNCKCPASFPTE